MAANFIDNEHCIQIEVGPLMSSGFRVVLNRESGQMFLEAYGTEQVGKTRRTKHNRVTRMMKLADLKQLHDAVGKMIEAEEARK